MTSFIVELQESHLKIFALAIEVATRTYDLRRLLLWIVYHYRLAMILLSALPLAEIGLVITQVLKYGLFRHFFGDKSFLELFLKPLNGKISHLSIMCIF